MTWLEELRARDPDRAGAALLAPVAARPRLLTLAALDAELSRIPHASTDPLLTEIRAQWWVEALERIAAGGQGETPLLQAVADAWGRDAARLAPLAVGWRGACAPEARRGADAILLHLDATAGEAMWQAAQALGATPAAEAGVRAQGRGAGAVAWLRAGGDGGAALAEAAGAAFAAAAAAALGRSLAPALYPGAAACATLTAAASGGPATRPSEFARRLSLLRFALTGRWQVRWRR